MCGHDLRIQRKRRQRVSFVDALLVLAVLAVLAVWWRIAAQPRTDADATPDAAVILPTNIPVLGPTASVSATLAIDGAATPTPLPTASESGVIRHRVQEGETLVGIAVQYDVTVDEIQAANDLENELIRSGDELMIPLQQEEVESGSADEPSLDQGETVSSRFEYTVQPGDTIVSIAARFGSTVEEILMTNNLTNNDFIRPGDQLLIPVNQVPTEVLASTESVSVTTESPTPGPVYVEPRLIGPPDEAEIALDEAALLRWISVDVLEPNEWYVLLIYPISGSARSFPSVWTKSTSYRLAPTFAPPEGSDATYGWQVSVVRVLPSADNQYGLEAASPPSELRSFHWR